MREFLEDTKPIIVFVLMLLLFTSPLWWKWATNESFSDQLKACETVCHKAGLVMTEFRGGDYSPTCSCREDRR